MEKNYLIKYCDYCGKELKLWPSQVRSKHIFCNKVCEFSYRKGRKVGAYSEYQVSAMVNGKRNAYISRVLSMEKNGKYDLDRIKLILRYVPISSTRQLAKILGFKESDSRAPIRELKYLLEYYDLNKFLRKEHYPECYTVMQPEQIIWFNSILDRCHNFYEFTSIFNSEYKANNVRLSAAKYKYLILYVQYSHIKTAALREDLTKNLQMCGTSCEIKVRQILDELKCSYIEQKLLPYKKIANTTNNKYSKLKPDFIVDDKFIIEVNGDYWHAYNVPIDKMNADQLKRTKHDIEKYEWYNHMNYRFIVIWEHELANISIIKDVIKKEILNERNYKTIIYN